MTRDEYREAMRRAKAAARLVYELPLDELLGSAESLQDWELLTDMKRLAELVERQVRGEGPELA